MPPVQMAPKEAFKGYINPEKEVQRAKQRNIANPRKGNQPFLASFLVKKSTKAKPR